MRVSSVIGLLSGAGILVALMSCRTIGDFTVDDHQEMMRSCLVLCRGEVRDYDSITAHCQCVDKKVRLLEETKTWN